VSRCGLETAGFFLLPLSLSAVRFFGAAGKAVWWKEKAALININS